MTGNSDARDVAKGKKRGVVTMVMGRWAQWRINRLWNAACSHRDSRHAITSIRQLGQACAPIGLGAEAFRTQSRYVAVEPAKLHVRLSGNLQVDRHHESELGHVVTSYRVAVWWVVACFSTVGSANAIPGA